jgi:cation transport ATPase
MGSKVSAAVVTFTCLLFSFVVVSAVETIDTDYRQTVYRSENFNCRECTSRIKAEVQRNDHTARVVLNSAQKNLLIIHHKSISIKQLNAVVANHGISTKAVTQNNYTPDNESLLLMSQDASAWATRYCGATKVAWKSLLHKYFH